MATNPLSFTLTPEMAPAAPLMRLLARFDRPKVEAFAEISVALLDLIDGDPEAEHGTWPEDMTAREHDAGHGEDAEDDDPAEVDDEPEDDDPKEDEHDREPEEGTIAHYGMDQSLGPVGPCSDTEPVW